MSFRIPNGVDNANQRLLNLADPSSATDGANKNYVDNAINGLAWKQPVRAASTTNLTLSAPQTIDGVAVVAGDRVLAKDQTTASANGIYVVAAGAWSRAADSDAAGELVNATAYVAEGTVNADKAFTQTSNAPITVGTTALAFAQVGGGTSYTAGNGLALSGTTFAVNPAAGAGILVAAGGVSVDTAVVVRKFPFTIGDGVANPITVTHNLNTLDVQYAVYEVATGAIVGLETSSRTVNTLVFTFAVTPTTGQYRVVVQG